MSTELIHTRVWQHLSAAARQNKRPAQVAVAYFGQGAAKLLPLPRGSQLVVDSSDHAVRSGQTHPADLLAMMLKRGVRVYSVGNLHAKVYVFGRTAFVGSANASRRASDTLVEAMLMTTDLQTVASAREFVRSQCLYEQSPELLKRLQRMYHPPEFPGGSSRKKQGKKQRDVRPPLPRLCLVHLRHVSFSELDESERDTGMRTARKRRQHPRSWWVDSFRWVGEFRYQPGEVVVMVTDEDARLLMSPPGNLLHVRRYRTSRGRRAIVFVEVPGHKRRRSLEQVAKRLGRGSKRRLSRTGPIGRALAKSLLALWAQ